MWNSGRLFERGFHWFPRELLLARARVFREGAVTGAVHPVALSKTCHVLTDGVDVTRHVPARHARLGRPHSHTQDAHHVGDTGNEMHGTAVHTGGDHPY